MDLKSLISKIDQLEQKKILTESEKKETSWTDMKGKKHNATQVKGKSYGNQPEPKEVDDEGKPKKKVKEGLNIAESLLESFGLSEAAPGEFQFTPEQEKWLGGANRQDPYILNRMPGDKPPVSYFKDPKDQALAKRMGFPDQAAAKPTIGQPLNPGIAPTGANGQPMRQVPMDEPAAAPAAAPAAPAAGPTGITATGDDEGNTTIERPDGSRMVVGPDGNAIPPGGGKAEQPAAAAKPAAGLDQAKVKRFTELLDKIKKGGAAPAAAPAKPAAKPATSGKPPAPGGAPESQPDWNMIGASQMTAESMDDYILKLIKAK